MPGDPQAWAAKDARVVHKTPRYQCAHTHVTFTALAWASSQHNRIQEKAANNQTNLPNCKVPAVPLRIARAPVVVI